MNEENHISRSTLHRLTQLEAFVGSVSARLTRIEQSQRALLDRIEAADAKRGEAQADFDIFDKHLQLLSDAGKRDFGFMMDTWTRCDRIDKELDEITQRLDATFRVVFPRQQEFDDQVAAVLHRSSDDHQK